MNINQEKALRARSNEIFFWTLHIHVSKIFRDSSINGFYDAICAEAEIDPKIIDLYRLQHHHLLHKRDEAVWCLYKMGKSKYFILQWLTSVNRQIKRETLNQIIGRGWKNEPYITPVVATTEHIQGLEAFLSRTKHLKEVLESVNRYDEVTNVRVYDPNCSRQSVSKPLRIE